MNRRRSGPLLRAGFSLVELILVLFVIGIIVTLGYPSMRTLLRSAALRSAKNELISSFVHARGAAIHHGRESRFVRTDNQLSVTTDSSGVQVPIGNVVDLSADNGVTLVSAGANVIAFDPRGFAIGVASDLKYVIEREGVRDSVCVNRLGRIRDRCA